MVVNRKGVTMMADPYSAGFCTSMKFRVARWDKTARIWYGTPLSRRWT
jgi:hypothetical protein